MDGVFCLKCGNMNSGGGACSKCGNGLITPENTPVALHPTRTGLVWAALGALILVQLICILEATRIHDPCDARECLSSKSKEVRCFDERKAGGEAEAAK